MDQAAGRCRYRSYARRTTTGAVMEEGAAAFDQDGRQHAEAIAEGVQVAHPVDPRVLETWHLSDAEPFRRRPQMDQCLDLEAVAPQPPVAPARRGGGDVEA